MKLRNILSGKTRKGLALLLLTNLSSFSTVAMEKNIAKYSANQAALVNSLHSIPFVYDIGFGLGHKVFYDDNNFVKTSERVIGKRNLYPRPYLEKISELYDKANKKISR